ncbi:MAG TPA: trypsin-like peptidase domain-containing protein [Candidatus Corynebacterium avicola]|uniref:Trypsin-like peptidase domain-containing protein n=1 Tax=Candidatus Corynebacterium avicola TaxID=2838527 RepID=A0A9D1RPK6_9CORY|nr:trypsin-like peptidase domain-containing protein [Candidatus Corynebacterium avicola]
MSGDNRDGQGNGGSSYGEFWGRNQQEGTGQNTGQHFGQSSNQNSGQAGEYGDVESTAAQQRHWESLSQQYPGQSSQASSGQQSRYSFGAGAYDATQSPYGAAGPSSLEPPEGNGASEGSAKAATKNRRFSTPAVAALLLAVGVGASVVTTQVMKQNDNGTEYSGSETSFSQQSQGSNENTSTDSTPEPGTIENVANKVLPSVVSIQVATQQGGAEGSGSIISPDGLILTNNHVVAEAESGQAELSVTTNDGRTLEADVVATDPQTDLAVVKAEGADDLKPIEVGDSDSLEVGQSVVAVGSPLGLSSTVTTGIVSAKNRAVQAGGEDGGEQSLIDAIQTDAAINPGNSGGALVNLEGQLVGIPSVIASLGGSMGEESGSIGLGFAIPSSQAEKTSQQLIDDGKATHPVIGAQVNTQSTAVGGEVVEVTDGGPAEEAGLEGGDVVTKVDDRVVDSGEGLIAAIRSHSVGDKVTLTVTDDKGENERELEVTLDESD